METHTVKVSVTGWMLGACVWFCGCGQPARPDLATEIELGATIGSLTEVFAPEFIPVEGYALVDGLRGTGSPEAPPQIRSYLKQYILTQLHDSQLDIDELINNPNTAVVRVHGRMPAAVTRKQRFDVMAEALPGTQTTSLEGGWLYRAELKRALTLGFSTRTLATVEGPIFIDTIGPAQGDKRAGYILAGGKTQDIYRISVALREPDYAVARRISDIVNTRFVDGTATAVSPDLVELKVPAEYATQRQRFIDLVNTMYLVSTPELVDDRVTAFIRKLAVSDDKYASEVSLEAIGNPSLRKLAALLNSSDQEVRLRAARCMLYLGSDRGLSVLERIAMDKGSQYRIEALTAVAVGAKRSDAALLARRLLQDDNPDVRLSAYEQLRNMDDITISQEFIGGNFYLEQITQTRRKEVFVSRSGQPRIVLLGAPISCRPNIFVQTADGSVTIDAPAGQKHVSLIRGVPGHPHVVKLKSSFDLADIIRKLAEEPLVDKGTLIRPGLNVSYPDTIALVKQMCDTGGVQAEFRAGPLPDIE